MQGALSWFVDNYSSLTEWRATVLRIRGFIGAIEAARAAAGSGIQAVPDGGDALELEDVTLGLPDGRVLIEDASARIGPGESV
ncbi:hypothetical protein LAN31_22680, partial [Mycobacterium tuberculosis]|nr:hypothetical protein [Mycobacterium tuberculosis]